VLIESHFVLGARYNKLKPTWISMCYGFVTAENKQPADFGMLPDNSGSADLNEKLLLQHGNPALVSLKV